VFTVVYEVNGGAWVFDSRRGPDGGATLVEFAVVLPLVLLMLFGVVEFARIVYSFATVWNSAREGARYATTVGDTDGNKIPNYLDCDAIIQAAVNKAIGVGLSSADISVKYFDTGGTEVADCALSPPAPAAGGADIDAGFKIEVEASATFNAIVPILSSFLDGIDLGSRQTRTVFRGVIGET
jgi:Flp pilus assembly protein TadG